MLKLRIVNLHVIPEIKGEAASPSMATKAEHITHEGNTPKRPINLDDYLGDDTA